jgi:O-acetylserine/cysteine efflux transporter
MNILILLVCVIWGSNWVFMKLSGLYFPPVMFSALRFVIATFVLLGIVWYKRTPLPRKQDWKWYAICGLLQTTYPYLVGQIALEYNNAAITSVLSFTMPFWLLILGHFTLNDRITLPKLVGLIVGILGLFLVMDINPWHMEWSGNQLLTELLVVTGAVAWAMANVILKKHLQNNDKLQFTTWQMVIGTLGLLVYSLLFEHGEKITFNWVAISCLLYAGVLSSAIGFLLWSFVLSKGDAVKASVALLLVPVIGSLCCWIFLGETLKPIFILGIVCVAAGIGVVNMKFTSGSKDKISKQYKFTA